MKCKVYGTSRSHVIIAASKIVCIEINVRDLRQLELISQIGTMHHDDSLRFVLILWGRMLAIVRF